MSWLDVKKRIEENWEGEVQISDDDFNSFSLSDWREFQQFLHEKTADFLHCDTWSEHMQQVRLSDKRTSYFYDTTNSINLELTRYQESINPRRDSQKLMIVAGTRSKISYGDPNSGTSYDFEAIDNVENELAVLVDVLKIGKKDNLIGESFDDHLNAIELLSDFGKSYLVWYLGDTPLERELLTKWSAKSGTISSSMTAAMIAGASNEAIQLDLNAVINPRFIHLLIDDGNITQPWWMEMALWAGVAESWKERLLVGPEDLNLDYLARYIRNALDPAINRDPEALKIFSQDLPMYQNLLEFLEE